MKPRLKPGPKPRLKRTLKRKPTFRDLEESDIKYLYAGYKKGLFDQLDKDLQPGEFRDQITKFLVANYHRHWIMEVHGLPVGLVFGIDYGPFILSGDATWFPWASKRNKVESMVNFLNEMRELEHILFYCYEEHLNYYNYIAKHGIIRKIGISERLGNARLWEVK